MTISGAPEYQACDDKVCVNPARVPMITLRGAIDAVFPDRHNPVGIAIGQRLEDHAADHAEDS